MIKFEKGLVPESKAEDVAVKNEIPKFQDKIKQIFSLFSSLDKEVKSIEKNAKHLNSEEIEEIKEEINLEPELEDINEEASELLATVEPKLNDTEKLMVELLEIYNKGEMAGGEIEAFSELYEAARKMHAGEEPKAENPLEILEEMKQILFARLYQLTSEARKENKPKNIDESAVRRAKIALLHAGDTFDLERWTSRGIENMNLQDLNYYFFPEKGTFSEEEIELILNTNLRKQFLSGDSSYYYVSKKLIECVPDSLLIAIAGKGDYYAAADALKHESTRKYTLDSLKQLIACGYSKLCLTHYDKFEDGLKVVLNAGLYDGAEAAKLIMNGDFSQTDKERYINIVLHQCHNLHSLSEGFYKFYDDNREVVELEEENKISEKLSRVSSNDVEFNAYIRELLSSGRTALVITSWGARQELEKIAAEDYDFFMTQIKNNQQEHLVIDLLQPQDAQAYAKQLIENGDEYLINAYLDKFPVHSLGSSELQALLKHDTLHHLYKKVNVFSELNDSIASELINRGEYSFVFRNPDEFNLSDEFVRRPDVQAAALSEIEEDISGYHDGKYAVTILKSIPIAPEVVDKVLMEAVSTKMFERDRVDWACALIATFPHLKGQLEEKHIEKAKEDLLYIVEKGYLQNIANLLEAIPLSVDFLNTPEMKQGIAGIAKRELHSMVRRTDQTYEAIKLIHAEVDRIAKFVELPSYLLNRNAIEKVQNLPIQPFNLKKEFLVKVASSEEPDELLERLLSVSNEIINRKDIELDRNIVLGYTDQFVNGGSPQEKEAFIESIKKDISIVAANKPVNFDDNKNYYRYILEQVYPQRNYNTYDEIAHYADRSSDLNKYKFDKEGYPIRLSGVLGYKLKDGATANEDLLGEFSKRIDVVKELAEEGKLHAFLDANMGDSEAKTLEGKILAYFKTNGYSVDTMNVLLAYQLLGSFDDFYNASADRVSTEQDQVSKNYIMLDELANQYGDNMKETIRSIQGIVANSEDRELFSTSFIDKYEKKYQDALKVIVEDLNKVPKDKIDTVLIRKKVEKTIKNIFQGHESILKRAKDFASLFEGNDWDDLPEVWKRQIDELFVIDEENCIDTQKVQGMQATIYNRLQEEVAKYEDIKEVDSEKNETKLRKNRVIMGYFSKNKENAHARMVGDVCVARDRKMLENDKYFEFVLFDQEKEKCVGTTMLLQMDEPDGKYLLYCPNPAVSLVSEVSAKKLYQAITTRVSRFAEENDFKAVLVDKRHGHSTNRAGLFQQSLDQSCLKNRSGQERTINLTNNHVLSNSYAYQNNLSIVWEGKSK